MAKTFDTSLVSDMFGAPIDMHPRAVPVQGSPASQQVSVILDEDDYDRIWDEVDARRREMRTRRDRGRYGPSQLIGECIHAFLTADPSVREAYYASVRPGQKRVGLRLPESVRESMEDEVSRRIKDGSDRARATVTSIVSCSIRMHLDSCATAGTGEGDGTTGDEVGMFSSGMIF